MKRYVSLVFVLALLLLWALPSPAWAAFSEDDEALVLGHVAEDYPDWNVSWASPYGQGRWNGELARHVDVGLYQIRDGWLIQKELGVLANPLWAGEVIQYGERDLAPVPVSEQAEEKIAALTQEELNRALHQWIDVKKIPGCAENWLLDGETWYALGAFSDKLVGIAEDEAGRQTIRVVPWDGQAYGDVIQSPPQETYFYLNRIHSDGSVLELMVDDGLVYVSLTGDAPGIQGINTGWGIWDFADGCVWDCGNGISQENSHEYYPGAPTYPLLLTEMDVSRVPLTNAGVLAAMDASGWACVKGSSVEMLDAVSENVVCIFARLFGRILEEREDFVLLQIGSEEHGISGWFRRDDLAFGQEGYTIPCGFPSYAYEEGYAEHLNEVLRGLPQPLTDDPTSVWLIGRDFISGDWLVLLDADTFCTAPTDAFSNIGEPEEYYDPRYRYHWDDDDLWTLEYIEDTEGLSFLRILMEDRKFVRDTFPQHCYLETEHDASAILMDYYMGLPDGPVDWAEVPLENHVWMTFEYLDGKWALTDCTDALTWMAEVKNGRLTFMDYDRPGDDRWQWQAALDDDLMTFDFSSLEALIAQYNALMPGRPSVAGTEDAYDRDDAGLRTLVYLEDDAGLSSLRIVMEDAVFLRDSFPQHCYLDTFYDGSNVFIDWYWNLPDGPVEDWTEVIGKTDLISLIFSFQEGKWALREATDWRTWELYAENGRCTFCEYDEPDGEGEEWQWTAALDDDLMTFDFSAFKGLMDQYNEIMADRPHLARDAE